MDRRRFLRALAGVTAGASLAGCSGLFSVRRGEPPLVEDRPDAVYYPTHTESMAMLGTERTDTSATASQNASLPRRTTTSEDTSDGDGSATATTATGDTSDTTVPSAGNSTVTGTSDATGYAFGLTYSYPHRFWTMEGGEPTKTEIDGEDSVHLMASVWDPATEVVLPDTGLSLEITRGNTLVSQETIYPMLSQRMGFHYGANFGLDGDGTYTVTLSVGGMSTRRTGAFVGRFSAPASVEVPFEYSEDDLNDLTYNRTRERAGTAGAVEPMGMATVPNSTLPPDGEFPGRVVGTKTTGDAQLLLSVLEEAPRGIDASGPYLVISARTPHNRMVLPMMALSGTLRRGDETVFEGELASALDPDLNYHYGATVESVRSGDVLSVSVETPPLVARHEGYETAFLDMPPVEFTL